MPEIDTLPPAWTRTTLGELGRYINGRGFKTSEWSTTGRPIIRIQDLTGSNRNPHFFDGEVDARYVVENGDLLISWSATLGAFIWDGPEAVLNQHIFKVESSIDKRLHYHVIRECLAELYQNAHGSGMVHVTKGLFDALPVNVPVSLAAQSKLASLLDSIEETHKSSMRYLQAARTAIERLRTAILSAASFGRLTEEWRAGIGDDDASAELVLVLARERRESQQGKRYRKPEPNRHAAECDLPSDWVLAPMGDLLEGLKYGTSKKSDYANAGIPILRIPNISAGHVDLTDMKFADLSSREANDLALGATDLLMIRSNGSPHLVGRTAIAGSTAAGMAYAGYLMRLRVDTDVCEPSYLALQLASPYVRRQIEMPLRSTSGVNNINTSEVNGLMIPLAPMAEQREIVRRTDEALACQGLLVGQVESALAAADRRSRSVLAKAFSGRLAGTV